MTANRNQAGFTIFEMVIVLVMVGLLTASIAPLLQRQHTNTMEEKDKLALESARTALINYAISNGGIPDPLPIVSAAGATQGALVAPFLYAATLSAAQPVGLMPPSGNPSAADAYAVSALGVNNWGVHGGNSASNYWFHLDVNDHLKSSHIRWISTNSALTYDEFLTANSANSAAGRDAHQTGDRVVFCQAVNEQMAAAPATPPTTPSVCQNFTTRTVAGVTTQCAVTTPVAFALFSVGNNRAADQENDDRAGSPATNTLKGNRIYENDSRGINNSPGDDRYDDQVMSYPLSSLARDCREKMGVAAEVMSCAPGAKYVGSVTNTDATARTFFMTGDAGNTTVPPNNFTVYVNRCYPRSAVMSVTNGGPVFTCNGAAGSCTLSSVDTNSDGRIDFVISAASTSTAQ